MRASPSHTQDDRDRRALAASIDAAPAFHSPSRSATFAFSTEAGGSAFECKLDQGAFAPCTSPADYAWASERVLHQFQVRATDGSGTGSVGHTWTVDTVAPGAAILTGRRPGALHGRDVDVLGRRGGRDVPVQLDAEALAACVSPLTTIRSRMETTLFSVQATDKAGSIGLSATHAWTVDSISPDTSVTASPPP